MSMLGVLRGPRQVLFGAGQRHALGTVVRGPGVPGPGLHRRPVRSTREFADLVRLLEDAGVQVTSFTEVLARRPRAPGRRSAPSSPPGGGARRRRRAWEEAAASTWPRPSPCCSTHGGTAVRLLRRAPRARAGRAGRRPAHHGGHRVGGDAGGRAHRSRPGQQGGDLQSLPDPARRRLRPGAHARLPAAAHGERGCGRPLPRRRGVHRDASAGDVRARHRARLRRQERADRHLRPPRCAADRRAACTAPGPPRRRRAPARR